MLPAVRRTITTASAVLGAALFAGAGWLIYRAVKLLNRNDLTSGEEASVLQAFGGAAALVATVALVGITAWYAALTAGMLKQSGPIVAVELRGAWINVHGGGAITAPIKAFSPKPPEDGFNIPMLAIVLRNSGNAAAEITQVAVGSDAEWAWVAPKAPVGPSCPLTLGPHSTITCYVDIDGFVAAAKAYHEVIAAATTKMRGVAELGSGAKPHSVWESTRILGI